MFIRGSMGLQEAVVQREVCYVFMEMLQGKIKRDGSKEIEKGKEEKKGGGMIPKEALFALTALMAVSAAFGWIINNLYTGIVEERREGELEHIDDDKDGEENES